MRARTTALLAGLALVLVFVPQLPAGADKPDVPGANGLLHRPVCGPVPAGVARCHAELLLDPSKAEKPSRRPSLTTTTSSTTSTSSSTSSSTTFPSTTSSTVPGQTAHAGYGPADLLSAYNLADAAAAGGSGHTVAIVDAYDDPNAEADLAVYRSYYGLPACTTANGCFRKVNQRGGSTPPSASGDWAQEISLDLDMVSATCPGCNILLVEGDSSGLGDLAAAVNTAVRLGATEVSNSYGASESALPSTPDDSAYNHPGVAITVSTGDNGYGTEFPASSTHVTAVGGTTLTPASNARGWSETAWSGAGSGCSRLFSKPSWQTDSGCSRRTLADVSAVANPSTGVAVYDSLSFQGRSGWLVFGGTSVASPIIASVYALGGHTAGADGASRLYTGSGTLFDVASGKNGTCSPAYLCTAGPGYDGPTGLGTPNGTSAF